MRKTAVWLSLLLLVSVGLLARQSNVKNITKPNLRSLHRGRVFVTKYTVQPVIGRAKWAGPDGVLMMFSDGGVHYISIDAQQGYDYDLNRIPEQHRFANSIEDFASDGHITYLLTHSRENDCYLNRYERSGKFIDSIKLTIPDKGDLISCRHIVAWGRSPQEILLSGTIWNEGSSGLMSVRPWMYIISDNGSVQRPFSVTDDVTLDEDKNNVLSSLSFRPNLKQSANAANLNAGRTSWLDHIVAASQFDRDSDGNVLMIRKSPPGEPNPIQPVLFILRPDGTVKRVQLEAHDTVGRRLISASICKGVIVGLFYGQNDASQAPYALMATYDLTGKNLKQFFYDTVDLGFMLVGWDGDRLLTATQTGNDDGKKLAFIEGLQ